MENELEATTLWVVGLRVWDLVGRSPQEPKEFTYSVIYGYIGVIFMGLGFRVWDSGFLFRVLDLGFTPWSVGFGISAFGIRV